MTFIEELQQVHNERVKNEMRDYHLKEIKGENIYINYGVWCYSKGKPQDKKNASVFASWLKSENITLTFLQKKHLAEKYFGYVFNYNENTNKWESKKI